jgi:hypothetical protein
LPDHTCRRNNGSSSFAAAIIFCNAFRSFGDSRAVLAVKTVGEKRRIFAGSEPASLALTACAAALTGKKPETKVKATRRQTILIDKFLSR